MDKRLVGWYHCVQQEAPMPEREEMQTSTRDLAGLRDPLERWLRGKIGSTTRISDLSKPSDNGLSSETLLFDAEVAGQVTPCVARVAPTTEAVPVFPSYDVGQQFEVMRTAREDGGVLAPRALWFEPDPQLLGTPFFVMERET